MRKIEIEPRCDPYIEEAFEENAYLRGDDCSSTRNFLNGWIAAMFRRGEGRSTPEEDEYILAKIDAFANGE